MYATLTDAASVNPFFFAPGEMKIWYANMNAARDMMMGLNFCTKHNLLPNTTDLTKTHALLGSVNGVAEENLEDVYMQMQGENWSPQGEARDMIRSLGLHHTSMSVGDIIELNGKFFFVDSCGFTQLNK